MSFVAVATLDELSPEVPLAVDEHELAIVLHQGEYFAIHNICSHGHVPLSDGDVEDGAIECYLHGSRFDLRSGRSPSTSIRSRSRTSRYWSISTIPSLISRSPEQPCPTSSSPTFTPMS